MPDGLPVSPETLKDIENKAKQLLTKLTQDPVALVLRVAGDPVPVQYTEKIIQAAVQYIVHWLLGPDLVGDVSNAWTGLVSDAQDVVADCKGQLDIIKNHWTGPAAEDFTSYANDLLTDLQSLPNAAKAMADGASQLADDLRHLRDAIVGDSFKIVYKIEDAITQIVNTVVNSVDLEKVALALTGAGAPIAVVQWCSAVAAKITEQVVTVITMMISMAQEVDGKLGDINNDAEHMKTAVAAALPKAPTAPVDGGDTKEWHPVAG